MNRAVPNMQNDARWDHIASEHEIATALRLTLMGKDHYDVAEIPFSGVTIIMVPEVQTLIRTSAQGGDVGYVIEGGWIYTNPFSLMQDWLEIKSIKEPPNE